MIAASTLMKRCLLTALLAASLFTSFAQDSLVRHSLHPLTRLDLGLQGVGVTFERRLGHNSALDLSLGAGGGYIIWYNDFEYNWDLARPALFVAVTPKFYYNRARRAARGKTSDLNAGNYIGVRLKYTSRNLGEEGVVYDVLLGNVHWGLQRPLGRRWTFNTHAGIGYATDATDLQNTGGTVYPALDVKFSYVFGKR